MPGQSNWDGQLENRVADQVDRIVAAFHAVDVNIGVVPAKDGKVEYMYAEDQLLVQDSHTNAVYDFLNPGLRFDASKVDRILPGVTRLFLPAPAPGQEQRLTTAVALEEIDKQFGVGVATPNHVLTVAPGSPCPATEPEEVYEGTEPFPSVCTQNGGAGVLIYIADTGLLEDTGSHSWLKGVKRAVEPDGTVEPWEQLGPLGANGTPTIPPYVGHGTFVAGVARCMAPEAGIIVSNIFKIAGSVLESDFVMELTEALDLGVDIFNLSITTLTRTDLPLLGFGAFLRRLRRYKGVVCVVAAGNDGVRTPSWPAAYPEMVSVGALSGDWRGRASFSNRGGWVDVYAPGRDLVNAYATGTYTCDDSPYKGQIRKFFGMAKWSGTSFSTPVVAGLIAARMSRTGENGQEAAAALLAQARAQAIPGVGAVLLPCGPGCGRPARAAGGCSGADAPAARPCT
jgi:subtilisin family serine protease